MRNENIKDERIVSQRRKIQSDAYSILISTLLVSVFIQQFIIRATFAQFAVEFFCLIGMGIYVAIRHVSIGVDIWNFNSKSNKNLLINSVFSGIIIAISLMVIAGEKEIMNIAIAFICSTVILFIGNFLLNYVVKRKQKQIDNELNEDE